MRSFTDTLGRTWTLEMTYGSYRRLRAQGFDGGNIQSWHALADDPDVLATVLSELCGHQMRERGIDQDSFEAGFDLEVAERAITEVVEVLIDFFPNKKKEAARALWNKVTGKATEMATAAAQKVETILHSKELDNEIEKHLTNLLSS